MQAPRRDRTGKPVRERGGAVVVLRRLDLIDVNAVAETLSENERCFQLRCDKRVLTDAAQCGITPLRWQTSRMGLPKPSAPTTSTTRWAFAGMTGSCGACALSGNVENCYTVSDKATAVGGGVLEAILHLSGALLED